MYLNNDVANTFLSHDITDLRCYLGEVFLLAALSERITMYKSNETTKQNAGT